MPYYTGTANSFAELKTALINACVAEGYTLVGTEILTKGTSAVRIQNNTASVADKDIGLIITGGLGVSAGALISPSPNTPRMGRVSTAINLPAWPMIYEIHIWDDPDEVYFKAIYNVDSYYWLAFGMSDMPGLTATGQWIDANAIARTGVTSGGVGITPAGATQAGSGFSSCALFWQTSQRQVSEASYCEGAIASGLDAVNWAGNPASSSSETAKYAFSSVTAAATLLSVLPNAWNSESPLVPVVVLQWRDSAKCSVVANLKHARYCRIDNYAPGQIITLGSDRWKVQPFYRKNSAARNGGSGVNHTGTFGWAIRYDGP